MTLKGGGNFARVKLQGATVNSGPNRMRVLHVALIGCPIW